MHGWSRIAERRSTLAGAVLALLCFAGAASPEPEAGAFGVRLGGDLSGTRVVIDTDHAISPRVSDRSDPRRLTVLLTGVGAEANGMGVGRGLVTAWRIVAGPQGPSLLLDLREGAQLSRRFSIPPQGPTGAFRYVMDIAPAVPQTDDRATAAPGFYSDRPLAVTRAVATSRRARRVVVIDAGHGGHDPGAQSDGANEKDITLAAALDLRARLLRAGRYKVVMTRESDVFIPLEERVRIARRAGADLFIALHADSAGADANPHGASVYTLADHADTRVREVLGHDEWFARTGSRSDPAVGRILLDLTQRNTKNRSAVFAGLLVDQIGERVDLLPHTQRDAGYFVLLAPDVPAVLLEMGFITCPADQERLVDPVQRGQLMAAVAAAIEAYFAPPTKLAER